MRLLPVLIGIGVVLLVTLRAYLLLQREVRLRKKTERNWNCNSISRKP